MARNRAWNAHRRAFQDMMGHGMHTGGLQDMIRDMMGFDDGV